jgi:hypothetical protein
MRKLLWPVLTAFLFLIPSLSWSVASVRQESASAVTSTAVTTVTTPAFGSNCLTGSLIEVWVIWAGSTNPTVADSASHSYTFKNSIFDSNDGSTLAVFILPNNSSTTALTVTATWSVAVGYQGIWAKEITGVTISPYQTSAGQDQCPSGCGSTAGTGAGAISSGNVTPTSQPALISALSNDDGGGASSTANNGTQGITGWTLAGSGDAAAATSSSLRVTSTSAVAMTFTNATDGGTRHFLTMAQVYTEASAGGPSPSQGFFIGATAANDEHFERPHHSTLKRAS